MINDSPIFPLLFGMRVLVRQLQKGITTHTYLLERATASIISIIETILCVCVSLYIKYIGDTFKILMCILYSMSIPGIGKCTTIQWIVCCLYY